MKKVSTIIVLLLLLTGTIPVRGQYSTTVSTLIRKL